MIGYIKGKVLYTEENNVLIENNGIGYEVCCSSSALCELVNGGEGEIYTYMAVREDGVYLYGFVSIEEKNMFLKLLTVSGVGPKVAVSVLSAMSLSNLALMIATSDVKGLSKIKGLGKKTAERIILELRENISSLDLPESDGKKAKTVKPQLTPLEDDAIIALMSLGFTRSVSETAVKKAEEMGADTIESIITYALQTMK
jgi:Holliday junction DNA helicase RuvA